MSRDAVTIVGALRRHARERPQARAIVAEGFDVSYGELATLVGDCASRLESSGIERAECVGITVADELAHLVVALGLAAIGAAHVVLPTFEGEAARSRLAARVGVRRLVATLPEHALRGLELVPLEAVRPEAGGRERAAPDGGDDPASLFTFFSTSGTTGEAKLIPMLSGRLATQAARVPAVCTMPLSSVEHHYAARIVHCLLVQGATAAIRGRSRTPVANLCASLRVEVVVAMLGQARTLTGEAERHGRLPRGTILRVAGARVSAKFRREMLAEVCDAVEILYAAQECGWIGNVIERDPERLTETVGRLHPDVDVRIVDERGESLPAGEIGEIRMRSPGMASAYHDDPAATSKHFRDGWFQPGDAGAFTPRGELMVYGRADEVMNLAGIKIAPLEIERVLERHPAVKAAIAFPLRSPTHGEIPVAAVEVVDGVRVDENELQAFARQALGLRAPRRVRIVSELPMTPLGKVDVRKLAESMAPPS